jgi:hypothetical protein
MHTDEQNIINDLRNFISINQDLQNNFNKNLEEKNNSENKNPAILKKDLILKEILAVIS